MAVQADISVLTDVERLLAACMRQFAVPDILVNNAGIEPRTSLLECTEEQFDRTLAVDLKGAFFCTQYVARELVRSRKKGRIINISSVHEERPMPGNTAYCCAKGGMRMLTRTAGLELAPHGIGVIGIAPGAVDTPMNAVTLNDDLARAALTRSIPLGRVASPEEIAGLAVWLASEEADYITATTIYMDGGLLQASTGL